MTEYRIARRGEEDAILDHINLVFSQTGHAHHFDRLIPKVYGHEDHGPLHFIAVENGRIRAVVGVLPMMLRMDDKHALKGGFVGSVSVHERARGAGHMKALMEMALSDAKEKGYDFLALGGQRQRYGYWGFENGGGTLHFDINGANIRHGLGQVDGSGISIRKIEEAGDAALEGIYALYSRQKMLCHRSRDAFLEIMNTWNHHLYALERADRLIGYYYGNEGWVGELALQDEGDLLPVIKAWMQGKKKGSIQVPLHMRDRARAIKAFAEEYAIRDGEMYRILNWPRVLLAALETKMADTPLADGCMIFEIEGEGRFALCVHGGRAAIRETRDAPEKCMTPNQAVEFFFSPFSALYAPSGLLKSWLPLPLNIPTADAF